MSEYQLRIYQIAAGSMTEFIAGWRKHIVPSREAFGFKVVDAWVNDSTREFVWLVRWDGPDGYAAADRAYYESPIRRDVAWDPTPFIAKHELRLLREVPFK
jgi:NIPSNAP